MPSSANSATPPTIQRTAHFEGSGGRFALRSICRVFRSASMVETRNSKLEIGKSKLEIIDICINNAIQFPSGGNTYAPTEGKCRFARGPSPAGAGPVGHGPVAERSGAPHPLCPEFGPALAAGTTPRGTRRFAGALLAGTPAEVGGEPAPSLGEAASPGTPGARLPDAVVDHGPHRRSHPARVRSALPSRSCRSADASPEVEPPET